MTMRRTELTKKTAANKGYAALGSATATVLLTIFFSSWFFTVLGLPITAFLTYRWLKFRAEWGMRF